ncbi:hypothetical protein OHC33_002812 [Knufia fluminis]|uniref:F-box domain-containing protein n=1 Tax=Knufia fluminis TaxID=191047 RepID=A0AAN8I5Y5_9EURO|nr:hypothetical protein OHC33_002812 [Knufia fluminis]
MATSFSGLPEEMLLSIVAWVPYDNQDLRNLRRVSRALARILNTASLPDQIALRQYKQLFELTAPLRTTPNIDWRSLNLLSRRASRHQFWGHLLHRETTLSTKDVNLVISTCVAIIAFKQQRSLAVFMPGAMTSPSHGALAWSKVVRGSPLELLLLMRWASLKMYASMLGHEIDDLLGRYSITSTGDNRNAMRLCHFAVFELRLFGVFGYDRLVSSSIAKTKERMKALNRTAHYYYENMKRRSMAGGQVSNEALIVCFGCNLSMSQKLAIEVDLPFNQYLTPSERLSARIQREYQRWQQVNKWVLSKAECLDAGSGQIRQIDLEGLGRLLHGIIQDVYGMAYQSVRSNLAAEVHSLGLSNWP